MDRRQFLILGMAAPILAACGHAGDGTGTSPAARLHKPAASGTVRPTGAAHAAPSRFTANTDGCFLLDGKPFTMAAGELHPQRIPHQYWDHRIKMVKAMGFNTISVYDFWSEHVSRYDSASGTPGYDFANGRNDLGGFLDLCRANNMWVFLRPGPFVDAYWDLGGIPGYLLATDGIRLRSSADKAYMDAVESYISAIAPIVAARLSGNGGPVLLLQVENEYTSFGYDTRYLQAIRALWEKHGIGGCANGDNVLLSTNNGINGNGSVVHAAAALTDQPIGGDPFDIGAGPGFTGTFDRTYALYRQPAFSSETYSGWDTLGSADAMYPQNDNVDGIGTWIDRFLHKGVSFSVYVAHGGTSFGYGAAGNYDAARGLFDPDVTSYDYRAPINEQGSKAYNRADAQGKLSLSTFDDIRTAFASALKGGRSPDGFAYAVPYSARGPLDPVGAAAALSAPPALPAPKPMIALSRAHIALTPLATLWDNLPAAIESTKGPLACESVGMYAGCGVVYSTMTPPLSGAQYLTLSSLADVATVFLDGALVGIIDRRNRQGPALGEVSLGDHSSHGAARSVIKLDFGNTARSARIDIFVYTFGHAHKEFTGVSGDAFRKGIWGEAYLTARPSSAATRVPLTRWSIHPLPMASPAYIQALKPLAAGQPARAGMFYAATFDLDTLGDTYVDVSTWNLGFVWVNGENIGRHFASASPQKILFCPATCLRKGANRIVIFDNYVTDLAQVHIELADVQSTYYSSKVTA